MNQNQIVSLISKIRQKANKFIISQMDSQNIKGLVTSHGDILVALVKKSQLTMKDLIEITGKDKSTITALVDKLVNVGYIEKIKSSEDTRITLISLSEKGKSIIPQLKIISEKLLSRIYKGISEEEKMIVLDVLSKIEKNI
jgi:MarR family transcriptional regulator, organic hydroperoxide resistance regulator